MLLGEHTPNFTGKGRIALPKKMREQMQGTEVVLTKGFEPCVFGYQKSVWEKQAEKQLEQSVTAGTARALRRYLFSGASIVSFDHQGRIVVPESLLSYAGITEDVIVIGAGDHFELWNTKSWKEYLQRIEREAEQNLLEGGDART
ncbi:MAG TPA: division/cell wall cluster transcriptional repressor MraZ [Patescibacteria group bacterium]|nr:division/cell wall cluster transcriptional repressor MraZ [Patescibacteria group bacterium]